MKKNNNMKSWATKNISFATHNEHDYPTPMETANANSNKRDRLSTPTNTPEKAHREKKAKGTPQENDSNTSADTILKAIDTLGKRVDDRMEEVSKQMQQHGAMLAAIAKSVQVNSEELEECKTKVKHMEKQIESLTKDNDDMKGRLLNQERYKR